MFYSLQTLHPVPTVFDVDFTPPRLENTRHLS